MDLSETDLSRQCEQGFTILSSFNFLLNYNVVTEGNISPNPPSGGSINDIFYTEN